MTKHSLTTTVAQIIEARDVLREFIFSAGLFDGCEVVYIRLNDAGDSDLILEANGTTITSMRVPGKRRVYAWTNAGTAELCEVKLNI